MNQLILKYNRKLEHIFIGLVYT